MNQFLIFVILAGICTTVLLLLILNEQEEHEKTVEEEKRAEVEHVRTRPEYVPTDWYFGSSIGLFLVSLFLFVLMIFFGMTPQGEQYIMPIFLCLLPVAIVSWNFYKRSKRLQHSFREIKTLELPFDFAYQGKLSLQIDVQIPLKYFEKPEGATEPSPLRQRFITDIASALIKFFETNPPLPITSSKLEEVIEPAVTYLQDSVQMSFVKWDCTKIHFEPLKKEETHKAPLSIIDSPTDRVLSLYVCGNPGSGKTSLLQHMIKWDIEHDRGVTVIDPTSDLIRTLMGYIPERRRKDVIYFDTAEPVPIDFLSYERDDQGNPLQIEKDNLIDDLQDIIVLDNAPLAKPYLGRIINTILEANEKGANCTFLDLTRFVYDPKRRMEILDFCSGERKAQFLQLPDRQTLNAITGRMIEYEDSPTFRKVFDAPQPKLNLSHVIETNKIFFVNLHDTDKDLFIGSLIASKIQTAIFRRERINENARTPYYLYVDECNTVLKFAAEKFEKILLRARKYKLCLTMANPIPSKLPSKIQDSLGTIANLALFNLNPEDARIFRYKLAPFRAEDLANLPQFTAIYRVGNQVSKIETPKFLPQIPAPYAQDIIDRTKRDYACEKSRDTYSSSNESRDHKEEPPQADKSEPPVTRPGGRTEPPRGVPILDPTTDDAPPGKTKPKDRAKEPQ